jgi:copper homeostasis protein CutC
MFLGIVRSRQRLEDSQEQGSALLTVEELKQLFQQHKTHTLNVDRVMKTAGVDKDTIQQLLQRFNTFEVEVKEKTAVAKWR